MDLEIKSKDGIVTIALNGGFKSCSDVQNLENAINQALNEGAKKFLIDLAQISKMNHVGVGILIRLYKFLLRKQAKVCFCHPVNAKTKLAQSKLNTLFSIYDSQAEAIAALNQS